MNFKPQRRYKLNDVRTCVYAFEGPAQTLFINGWQLKILLYGFELAQLTLFDNKLLLLNHQLKNEVS